MAPGASDGTMRSGFRLPMQGGRLILSERRLWAPAMAPIGLSLVALGVAVSLLVSYAAELYTWVTHWMPLLDAETWWSWLWIGPAIAVLKLVGALLFATIAGISILIAFLVASILASPFLDLLSYRVESLRSGEVVDESSSGLLGMGTDVLRSMAQEMRRVVFFLIVVGSLSLVGFVIPGAHLLTGPAIVAITIFFLPLDYASFTLDRRQLSFRQKREWLLANKPPVVGFGAAAFLICLVPGLNLLAMPMMVAGGTLLVLRHAPQGTDSARRAESTRAEAG
ncbi:MAG: EI24 domain-containing protein [Myxococcota bacterium]|nr:EI24 domain-containing protein [Myxococcota bacterium]